MAFPSDDVIGNPQVETAKRTPRPSDAQIVQCLKPLWVALQAVGLYPVHTGDPSGGVSIAAVLYAAVSYAGLLALLATAAASAPPSSEDEQAADFDSSVSTYAMYLLLTLPVVTAPLYFASRQKLHRYLIQWAHFEEEFLSTTGSQLELPKARWWPVVLGAGVWPAAGGVILLPKLNDAGRPLWLAALAAHSAAESSLLAATAALHCRAARSAAKDIAVSLGRQPGNPTALDGHRCLWLHLSRLVRDFGAAILAPLSSLLLLHFSLLTLAAYALLGSLLNTASLPVPAAAFLVATAAATLATCCDSGHRTTAQVRGVVEDQLEFLREQPSSPVSLNRMFDVFLRTMAMFPAKISLAGMTTMNRGLLTSLATRFFLKPPGKYLYQGLLGSGEKAINNFLCLQMVSTMVTYLVVIVQFRVSHEVLKNARNETSINPTNRPVHGLY